jgi:hypothetical protein
MTTPATFQPELRAHFLQGHAWVKQGTKPPASTHLKSSDNLTLDRDANGNAIVINAREQPVPRLPFIELGEARFSGEGLTGTYEDVKTITELGFRNHPSLTFTEVYRDHYQNFVDVEPCG